MNFDMRLMQRPLCNNVSSTYNVMLSSRKTASKQHLAQQELHRRGSVISLTVSQGRHPAIVPACFPSLPAAAVIECFAAGSVAADSCAESAIL